MPLPLSFLTEPLDLARRSPPLPFLPRRKLRARSRPAVPAPVAAHARAGACPCPPAAEPPRWSSRRSSVRPSLPRPWRGGGGPSRPHRLPPSSSSPLSLSLEGHGAAVEARPRGGAPPAALPRRQDSRAAAMAEE